MDPKQIVRVGYNTIARQYLEARSMDGQDVQLLAELIQRLHKGARVLDAGCGAGVPVTRILSEQFQVIGLDFSAVQVRLASQLVPRAHFVCQDIAAMGFADNTFDALCSYYAIIHIPRQEHRAVLAGFHRILKPAGLALLCMGAADSPGDTEDDYQGIRMYWSHYDRETNLQMLCECGLETVWARFVVDPDGSGGGHLFVLAEKH
jgi:ubiquinone/menaquinone biosynthesis C-methylase UbiE